MKNLLYPLTRAVYGYGIREPYASEFAVSGRLATDYLAKEIWTDDWAKTGPEICLTITALTGTYKVCQSFLGNKAPADRSATDLVAAMRRTAGALFWFMDSTFPLWNAISHSKPVDTVGARSAEEMQEPAQVNRDRLREMFATGVAELEPVFKSILTPPTLVELQRIATLDLANFSYPPEIWVKTVLSLPLRTIDPLSIAITSFKPWSRYSEGGPCLFYSRMEKLRRTILRNMWSPCAASLSD